MDYQFHLLLLVWLFSDVVLNTNVSIGQNSGYEDLRECAALCLEDPATYVDVRSFIGCPAQPYGQDACYCAEDLHSSASEYITQCVTMACGPSTADVQSAISVYDNYCFTAIGATPIIAAVPASTTAVAASNTAAGGNTIATTTINGVVETGSNVQSTADAGSSNTGWKGFTESDKIALGCGIGFGIPSVIGVLIAFVVCMRGN